MDAVSLGDTAISVMGEAALQAGEDLLIAEQPWLGLPIVRQVFTYLMNQLASYVILELKRGSEHLIIEVTDEAQNEKAKEAALELRNAATKEDHDKALLKFKDAYRNLIRERVSTAP